jgi:methylenetetrahydrofolate dehydrogenase (NADP+) / methenyltetrahydrofolate cyclohydrolase
MVAQLIDGKAIAGKVRGEVAEEVLAFADEAGRAPVLAVVLVGDNPASAVYVRNKAKACAEVGITSLEHILPASASQKDVEAVLDALSTDDAVDGILLQLPLPAGLDEKAALMYLSPEKDVDGLTVTSSGQLLQDQKGLAPCTPAGCVRLAQETLGEDLSGKHCVVIGRSILVGKPAALLFLAQNCTVSMAHSRTSDLPALCRQADILVPAIGRPLMVKAEWIKPGATVIDVGITRLEEGGKARLVGDVDFEGARVVAGAITPVPGGVGPMTIAYLLKNAVAAAWARRLASAIRGD